MIFSQKLLQLKKQKQDLSNKDIITTNDPIEKKKKKLDIDNQINQEKENLLNQEKQQKEEIKKQLMTETRHLIKTTYGELRRLGIIKTKQDYSIYFDKSPSFYLVYECDERRNMSYESLRHLRENLTTTKYELKLFLKEDEDPVYTDWVKRKIDTIINDIERLEVKIMRYIYGVEC